MCAITADNASNNTSMAKELEKKLKGSRSRFTKQYLVPCMAHVLNLAVQNGLKELDNYEICLENDEDDEQLDVEDVPQKPFGEILHRLRKLVIAINSSTKRLHNYKDICEDQSMPNKNMLVEDVSTRWNSTCDMIEVAWEKREVLKIMAIDHLNSNKANYFIADEEWKLLKMFADELLAFRETSEVFCISQSISSSNVSSLYGLLVQQLESLIFDIDHPLQDLAGTTMSRDQAKVLRRAYNAMKEKLLKYEPKVRRRPMFPIATTLDPRFKLEHIPEGEHTFVIKILLDLLETVNVVEASSSRGSTHSLASSGPQRSKVMMQFMERKQSTSTVTREKSRKDELEDYLREPCIDHIYDDPLQWWRKNGSDKYPRLSILAKEFLSICASSAPCERLFSTGRGIVTYKRARLAGNTISALMTLKSWCREPFVPDDDDSEVEEMTAH